MDALPLDVGLVSKQLPMELILQIIAILDYSSDTYTYYVTDISPCLTACSLVCHAWNDICRPRIFRKVVIYDIDRLSLRLSFLHSTAPHLCEYVLDLRLGFNVDSEGASALPSWVLDCFKRFKNLRVLYLWDGTTDVLASLDMDITPLLAAPRLRKLCIHRWSFDEDASDLLRILLSTNPQLEELTLREIFTEFVDEDSAEAPSAARFEALRRLEMFNVAHPMLRLEALIECPNLNSLVARWPMHWNVPPWCPPHFSELDITVDTSVYLPDFGKVIQPSAFTINISGFGPISRLTTWIKNCINRLPFPDLLHRLTINADITEVNEKEFEVFYREIANLFRFLQQIRDLGRLEGIIIVIYMPIEGVGGTPDTLAEAQARESAKLEEVLGTLLKNDGLYLDVTLEWIDGVCERPAMSTRVQRVAT
ncbi:hypothetical protein CCMSSC00406_0004700 [Pleurotus cornucopiae]|uniref:Uncharacterized protein n=1 Tax=Pleurotus cornucopiae TaxID=5321 RepID=A0ACB7J252_PLECO|nr:hypothetical protein CCMSSC00406_0004700 [Pleurotus cornucopiae]